MSAVRVVVVDDSALCRELLREALEADGGVEVVAEAASGAEALERVEEHQPDLVTLDVAMPGMDGLETVARLMADRPVPVLVVTELPASPGDAIAFEAIRRGALDVARKPTAGDAEAAKELRERVKMLATVPVVIHPHGRASEPPRPVPPAAARAPVKVIGIGASAGGPAALATVLSAMPAELRACVAVVQHLPIGFAEPFARFLGSRTALRVSVARSAVPLAEGTVVLPPDGRHLVAIGGRRLGPSDAPPVSGHRPSVDVLFRSLAEVHGAGAVGVLLTGIGSDGAAGLDALHRAGAVTIAQDRASSSVWGMPRVAIERGAAARVLGLAAVGPALTALARPVEPARRRTP
jgi:two-component system chemotaxis response regulator CheB